jgi:hypothetical protein
MSSATRFELKIMHLLFISHFLSPPLLPSHHLLISLSPPPKTSPDNPKNYSLSKTLIFLSPSLTKPIVVKLSLSSNNGV